jgi:hypothetical protein
LHLKGSLAKLAEELVDEDLKDTYLIVIEGMQGER